MSKRCIIINISDGVIQQKKPVKDLFSSLSNGKYKIEVSSAKQRSLPQNRYYFGLVVPMIRDGIKEMGTELTIEETHEFLKKEFNYKELVNQETGECKTIPLSTTRLTTVGFMEFIEKVQRFASEFLGIVIPDPATQMQIDYEVAVAKYDQEFNSVIVENGK